MSKPANERLYKSVKKLADKKFQAQTSVYKSSWIVREYKKRGGKYKSANKSTTGLKRWFREDWVDLNRPIKNSRGKIIGYKPCGRSSSNSKSKYPLCRPSRRVSKSTPRTYREISKRSLSRAKREKRRVTSHKNIKFGAGSVRSQYHGRRSSVMVPVPANVKKWALYAFKLKKLGFQGATSTGWRRARQLATQETIPIEDLRYMRAWYARHIYTSYPGFKKWEVAGRPKTQEWHKKHAIVSWITWGSNAGLKWVNSQRVINMLNKHFNKDYKVIKRKSKV
jgi:hypothetical protein